jgi:hypothetical protein
MGSVYDHVMHDQDRTDVTIEMNEGTEQLMLRSLLDEFEYQLYEEGAFNAQLASIIEQLIDQIGEHEAWHLYDDARVYDFELSARDFDAITIAVGNRIAESMYPEHGEEIKQLMRASTQIADQLEYATEHNER